MAAERASLPVWVATAVLVPLVVAVISLAYQAGGIVDGLTHLAKTMEKIDTRTGLIADEVKESRERIIRLETESGMSGGGRR